MFRIFFFMLIFSSCAKTVYIAEQARGQFGLQWNARTNQEMLADPNVSEEHKEKIKLIETYRQWFFDYWQRPADGIYSKTTLLENEAVTWLVIASAWNEIKAREECFPFTGCFPYIGFFKKQSAQEWVKKRQDEGYQTWLRPVYAYSTLGHFEDRILSSFFQYDQYELAELVFHEMFHVMYFLKNNVDFNENIANFFGEQMAREYFKQRQDPGFEAWKERMKISSDLRQLIAHSARELQNIYGAKKLTEIEAKKVLNDYVEQKLRPALVLVCEQAKLKKCKIAEGEWNNARLAALMTYEKAADDFTALFKTHGNDLKSLLAYVKAKEKEFQHSAQKDFTDFLFSDRMVENSP